MNNFQWAKGFQVDANPNAVGEVFARLEGDNQPLDEAVVVEEARDVNSPLHPCFEWNDSVAARQHRLTQARYIIRGLCVLVENDPDAEPIRAYVSIKKPREVDREYVALNRVMSDAELFEQACQQLKQELARLESRYKHFVNIASVLHGTQEQVQELLETV